MASNEYHKIDSIYLRNPDTKYKTFLMGQWSRPEFGYLATCPWVWTEKVDGTNIRVMYDRAQPRSMRLPFFAGRTDAASIPGPLVSKLVERFHSENGQERLASVFPDDNSDALVTLYGEGYGRGIQKGGELYRESGPDFILFDIRIGNIWLKREDVELIALQLQLDLVPIVDEGTIEDAVAFVREGFRSRIRSTAFAEGLVLRPAIELNDRMGRRVITKIKTKDFVNG